MELERTELELGPNGGTRKRGNNAEVKKNWKKKNIYTYIYIYIYSYAIFVASKDDEN